MLRYYLIATVIVVLIGATVVAQRWLRGEVKIGSVDVPASPRPDTDRTEQAAANDRGVRFESRGALSTLPDCLKQTALYRGPRAFVDAHVPTHDAALASGTVVHVNACTITIGRDDVLVTRGADRARVPALSHLARIAGGFLLTTVDGAHEEARSYRITPASAP